MEVYAGFAEHTDAQVGRLVDALSELGVLDDTLIFYVLGDNGASAEGPFVGAQGFAIKFKMDVEELNTGTRRVSEEVGVYTVNNGKIVREEFMYGPSHTVSAPGSSAGLAPVGG